MNRKFKQLFLLKLLTTKTLNKFFSNFNSSEVMKLLTILFLKILLLSNFLMAETLPTKSKILIKSSQCIKESQNQECKELVSQIEELKSLMFDQNKFKCQSSLLGLQSELIEAYFLKKNSKRRGSIMIPYVNKNC
jgi:hypothetical protein